MKQKLKKVATGLFWLLAALATVAAANEQALSSMIVGWGG
jgi:hypothetical protein